HDEAVSLSLTGGRDSRLVAAVLHAAGIPFRATTRGFDDHPDVILARRICERLGVADHQVTAPERDGDDAVLVEHPLPRTTRLLRMTEGMNSAFENVIAPKEFLVEARLSGSGGEALRGGWLNDQKSLDRDSLLKKFNTITRAQTPLMTPQAKAEGDRLYTAYTEEFDDPAVGLDRMFLRFRSGRWLPGSRTATLIGYCMYHPFLDHRVRWEAMRLSPRWRWSEDVVFQLLEHLAPELARLPVADRPWRFDQRLMLNPLRRRARRRRHALKARTTVGGFDWRRKLGPDYIAPMRERILDTPDLFELVDKERIETILNQDPVSRPQQ
ncbi:asparagine synthase-related protein, partial [Streptomonospora algeriensis]